MKRRKEMADIKQLPGTEPIPKWSDLITKMVEEFPAQIQYIECRAKMARHAYKTLLTEGFTHKEALELCTRLY
jgi:hypothetical protein